MPKVTQSLQKTNLILFVLFFLTGFSSLNAQTLLTGADQTAAYLPLLKSKRVGIVANHTSFINRTHLVDSLQKLGINIQKVFGPEHGFRGEASAGEHVGASVDKQTGITVVSLYGKNKKPTTEQMQDIDIVIFDIQDVGARFYTYISTMSYVMEACAERKIPMVVLDRPNPNGHYIDGPVLEKEFASFVGLHPVPIVHGMTVGEYARMVNGEGWLKNGMQCELTVIPCKNYDHRTFYQLPIRPSPNLRTMESIYLYPSVCLFEGTVFSVGRGTDKPFEIIGNPDYKKGNYTFTPKSTAGAKNPKHDGLVCNGYDLTETGKNFPKEKGEIKLKWLLECYLNTGDKEHFFTSYFNTLAGTAKLKEQVIAGKTESEIKESWKAGLDAYQLIRKKYLLYTDF